MEFANVLLTVIGGLLTLLVGLLAHWAKKVDNKLDRIEEKQTEHNTGTVERLVRLEQKQDSHAEELNRIDIRVRSIEEMRRRAS